MANNIRNTVLSIMDGIITVKVVFSEAESSQKYTYLALESEGFKVGDNAVVESNNGHRMVKVVSVDDACDVDVDSSLEYKFVIARINTDAHEAKSAQVDEAVKFFKRKEREKNRAAARHQMLEDSGAGDEAIGLLSFSTGEEANQKVNGEKDGSNIIDA